MVSSDVCFVRADVGNGDVEQYKVFERLQLLYGGTTSLTLETYSRQVIFIPQGTS